MNQQAQDYLDNALGQIAPLLCGGVSLLQDKDELMAYWVAALAVISTGAAASFNDHDAAIFALGKAAEEVFANRDTPIPSKVQ
jgi:hypothetical protein